MRRACTALIFLREHRLFFYVQPLQTRFSERGSVRSQVPEKIEGCTRPNSVFCCTNESKQPFYYTLWGQIILSIVPYGVEPTFFVARWVINAGQTPMSHQFCFVSENRKRTYLYTFNQKVFTNKTNWTTLTFTLIVAFPILLYIPLCEVQTLQSH